METVQIFTANPRSLGLPAVAGAPAVAGKRPIGRALADDEVAGWRADVVRLGFARTVSHDSYLINLASPDESNWQRSIDAFTEELRRCQALGISYLVMHPGAHVGSGEEAGLAKIVAALDRAHAAAPDGGVLTCLEITAGQGTNLGYRLEQLEEIIAGVKDDSRLGVCLDTAHLFAAGYDFRGMKYDAFRKQIEKRIGLRRVKVWHLNDSKKELGSRVDRHDHIGEGTIGLAGFAPIVQDPAWKNVPKILETPKEEAPDGRDWDAVNLERLRGLV